MNHEGEKMKKIGKHVLMTGLFLLSILLLVGCKDKDPQTEPTDPIVVTYQVTFNADNGTTPVVVDVSEGGVVSQPANPTKTGFTFNGWFLGENQYVFSTPVTQNITLVARYTEIIQPAEYTVTFNSVGGTSVSTQTIVSGGVATAPENPQKTFFVFDSWLKDGTTYNFASPVTSNIELHAKYTFVGIPNSPNFQGRIFNGDFDQMINTFDSGTLTSEINDKATIASDQPYISVGYSGTIGNNPDGALWKQAGSQNGSAPAFQYLVIRMRGFAGASIHDLAIGFRLDDNHEVLVVPFVETFDPDLDSNDRELDGTWYNYVISITDTLDGKEYLGKTGFTNVPASGVMVGFHLMNISEHGSGILEIKDAYYSKVPNPIYPYEGSDYSQNRDYWSGTVGTQVGTYVTIEPTGFYGEYVESDVNPDHTHVVLRMRQATPGTLNLNQLSIAPVFANGTIGDPVSFEAITGLPESLGSGWLNIEIPFADIYDGELEIAGYKLINGSSVSVSISQSFLTYMGDYQAVDYPVLNFGDVLIYDNFERPTIGATLQWSNDNQVAIDHGFSYIISYSGLHASSMGAGFMTLDSTGGEYVSYKVHSLTKANQNEYRYLVMKVKLNDGGTFDNLRVSQLNYNDQSGSVVYANQWVAGLGLPTIPEDMGAYPYISDGWTYLIIDLSLTPGYSTDFAGFEIYYTGSSISFDVIFFANPVSEKDQDSELLWATFEGLDLGSAQGKVSDNQWWANVYDSPTTIVMDGDSNQALQLDGTGYAQYHTGIKGTGRYLAFDLKILTQGTFVSFRVGPTGAPLWAKDGQLILENGTPMVVNTDGQWHRYVIDWVASGISLTDTIGFHASDGEIYLLDNIAWYGEYPYYDEALLWGSWDSFTEGDAQGQIGDGQWWANNYGTPSSFVDIEGNIWLKLDASSGYVQYHTGVKARPRFISFDIKVEQGGSLGLNVGGTHKWNNELIGLNGEPIVLPSAGGQARVIIDVLLSGMPLSDEFGIQANDGAIYYIDNISFEWLNPDRGLYPILTENFEDTPVNDGSTYWWGEWAKVQNGQIELITDGYTTVRFGSPLIAGAKFITFDIKLAEGNNADSFRIEIGDGNIVNWSTLIADGYAQVLTENVIRVAIPISVYLSQVSGLQVLGFHINDGGVIIDNMMISQDVYGYQMSIFNPNN